MKKRTYNLFNHFKNRIYKIKPVLRVYSFFRSDIPDRIASNRLKKNGYKDLESVFTAIKDTGIICFCDFGTLLGFIREGMFIPHDNDIDLGVIGSEGFSWDLLDNALQVVGINLIHRYSYKGVITEQTYRFKDGLSVDFFLYEPTSIEKMRTYVYYKDHSLVYDTNEERSVKALVYPAFNNTKWIEINGYNVCVPEKPEYRLEAIYGKTWKIPNPNYVPDRKLNIMPEKGLRIDL